MKEGFCMLSGYKGSCRRGLVDSMVRGYNRLLGQLQKGAV